MPTYHIQPVPPSGAFQQGPELSATLGPLARAGGGVVGPSGRGHGTLDPRQALDLSNRAPGISVLQVPQQLPGRAF